MNFISFSSIVAFSLVAVAGCAASTEDSADSVQDELRAARPTIELETTREASSVQAKLFTLLETFKADADLGVAGDGERMALTLTGAPEAGVAARSIGCNVSQMELVGPGGSGFSHRKFFRCSLEGFDQVRNGGVLPSVIVPIRGKKQLAGKLFNLLAKGADKGGLGVKRSGGGQPHCCDIPTSVTYTIADDTSSLACTMRSGGLAAIQRAECTFAMNDQHATTQD